MAAATCRGSANANVRPTPASTMLRPREPGEEEAAGPACPRLPDTTTKRLPDPAVDVYQDGACASPRHPGAVPAENGCCADPAFIVDHPLMITAWGRKRGTVEADTGAAEAEHSQVSQQSPPPGPGMPAHSRPPSCPA